MAEEERKRRPPRIHMPFSGTATVEGKTIEVLARDISETGAFLWASTVPEIGDRVKLQLQSASGASFSLKADGVGTVVRVGESSAGLRGFAVHFDDPPA